VIIFDAHCDTLQKITDFGGSLQKNSFNLDAGRIKEFSDSYVQVFAAFIDRKENALPPFQRCNQLVERYFSEIKECSEVIRHCETYEEIKTNTRNGRIAALLGIEGGEAIEGSLEKLRFFYEKGVRVMTLTWNYSNEICDGIGEERGGGLTAFGKKVVSEMNSMGMLIDVSHISVKGFWDVIEMTTSPVAATHSNAFGVCPHKRNLNDSQIKAIIKNNGCIGINLYPPFLSKKSASISDILKHVEYILALGGKNNIGLGCDFDGVDELPEGISDVRDLHKLFDEMSRLGYTDLLIRNICSGNFLRLAEKIFI